MLSTVDAEIAKKGKTDGKMIDSQARDQSRYEVDLKKVEGLKECPIVKF